MAKMVKPVVVLFTICLVISAALAVTYAVTKDRISEGEAAAANAARAEVLPGATFMPLTAAADSGTPAAYPAVTGLYEALDIDHGAHAGYVADVTVQGYGGELNVIVGIGADMKVAGVRVTSHSETAGLGANSTSPAFYGQFSGKDAAPGLNCVKSPAVPTDSEIMAISGATITSDAVVAAVNAAVDAINNS